MVDPQSIKVFQSLPRELEGQKPPLIALNTSANVDDLVRCQIWFEDKY